MSVTTLGGRQTTVVAAVRLPATPVPDPARVPGPKGEFRRGALTMLPLLVGYLPFAGLIGVTVAASITPLAAWSGV